jgi:hypothetical protein
MRGAALCDFIICEKGEGVQEKEIKVTEEMLCAGRTYLWDEQVMPWEDRDDVLTKIYRAMVMSSPNFHLTNSQYAQESEKS